MKPISPDGDLTIPIHTSVIFSMNTPSTDSGLQYGRIGNRTRQALEEELARVHKTNAGFVTSSGSSAIVSICLLLSAGSTIVHHTELYDGTRRIFHSLLSKFGIRSISCDFNNRADVLRELRNNSPTMIWIETPTNPSLRVIDIKNIAQAAHTRKSIVVVDTTMCSGIVQQPISLGADIVVESLTKALNGHSDALGGFIGTDNASIEKQLRSIIQTIGPVLSPWECSLILRGLKTAALRIHAQQQNAMRVSKWLLHNPHISSVMTPGSFNNIEEHIRKSQMCGKGVLVSFILHKNIDPHRFITALRFIHIAHSFGGTETLIQQPSTMMDNSIVPVLQRPTDHLFRLSIGLDHVQDIIRDLRQAIEHGAG